ncbi:MAG: M28 family peptidase, partial [Bacteroidia bacterium]
MKKIFRLSSALFLLFLFFNAAAQQEKIDYQTISKIKDEAFNRSQVMDILFNLTDVVGPRLSGSTNLKNAQVWAQKKLTEWGMENSNIEPWGGFGRGWEVQKSYIAMTVPYYQSLIAIPKAWTPGTNGLISGNVVIVKIETEQDFEKYKGTLKGKIVIVSPIQSVVLGLKPDARRYTTEELHDIYMDKSLDEKTENRQAENPAQLKKMRELRLKINPFLLEEGAAVLISSRGGIMGTFFTTNGASYATNAKPVLPELEMGSEHINRLIRLLEAGKEVTLEAEIKTEFSDKDTMQYNVIAEIPGTDKNLKSELVMIGAHLDSWHAATGTTDNAAGSAVMMEVMRILKAIDVKPRRTIRIALWSVE